MIKIWIAYLADLAFGDPYWIPHPIRFIGSGIKRTEIGLRKHFKGPKEEKLGGVLLTLIIVATSYWVTYLLIRGGSWIHPKLGWVIETFLAFQILATKSLDVESRKVYHQLRNGDLEEGRRYLSYIVGRETKDLNETQIARAAIETVAENISDGIIAPLCYLLIGGAPLGMAYKAINTLDSMVGYQNERYMHFGWASAKLDDLANYVPARLTGIFIAIASLFMRHSFQNAMKILMRDCKNHKSPNSGFPESAMAGALCIQIGGTNTYFGKKVYKPTIGDAIRSLEIEDILRTIHMMYATSFVGCISLSVLRYLIISR